jgi:hypothetical protein
MKKRGLMLCAAVALAMACVPAIADAAKFCVQKPQCVNQGGTTQATIQAAITAAANNGAGKDRIELGPQEFNNGPFTAEVGNPVNVVGAGVGKTTLTRVSTTNNVQILNLKDPRSSVSGLKSLINAGSSVTGIQTAGTANGVRVRAEAPATGPIGVSIQPGGELRNGDVKLPTATIGSVGLILNGDGASAATSRIEAWVGGIAYGFPNPAVGRRLRITAASQGWSTPIGTAKLDQATIRMAGQGIGLNVSPSTGDVRLVTRHVTVVGSGEVNSVGAAANALGIVGVCPVAELVLRNVIVRGFDDDLRRTASSVGCTGTPEAHLNLAYTVFDPANVFEAGAGSIVDGKGNRNVNPRFVKPATGNYHLKASSPVIDKGEPGKPKKGQSKVDLDGRKRVLDGDGNGKARRDIGAFERP